jgi:trk system potassium uptake protein TrkA
MKILILGAGRVGESVAESLVSEQNDITVIDTDPGRLAVLQDKLDLRGVTGNGVQPSVLEQAGASDADMLIACAALDETNLVACKLAHQFFNIPTAIARLRSPDFLQDPRVHDREGFAVDHVICPEESVMRHIQELIHYPEALQVLSFSQGRANLVAVRVMSGSALAGCTLKEFRERMPNVDMRVVGIYRQGVEIEGRADTRILQGDEVFVLAEHEKIRQVLVALHKRDRVVQRVMIAGGGRVGLRLARSLADGFEVKILEQDKRRCEYLASQLPDNVLVLAGDAADEDLLGDENVGEMDFFLALTNDDEDNIMAAMLAKRMGAQRVMALINRQAYAEMMEGSTIDIALSPSQTVIGELLTHVRRGDVVAVHSLRRGAAEVIEGVARGDAKTSRLVGRRIAELKLPRGVRVGAVIRGQGREAQVLMPHHDVLVQTDDHVVMFVPSKRLVREVEKFFQVSAFFF